MSKLTDDSKMPFGKYEGDCMDEVQASYLIYLRDQISDRDERTWTINERRVMDYIEDNMDVLDKELEENKR